MPGGDVVDAGEADGTVVRRDTRHRRTLWTHAEGFFEDGSKIEEGIEGGRRA